MKVNELRQGNWIHTGDFHIAELTGEYQYEAEWHNFTNFFSPIPLTIKWLLDFDFERISSTYYALKGIGFIVGYNLNNELVLTQVFGSRHIHIYYVHELQNLYHSLTRKELETVELEKTFSEVHISQIRPGDTIVFHGIEKTVTPKDIGRDDLLGPTLFGDSYRAGSRPVRKVNWRRLTKIYEWTPIKD